jgi:hypothetical protein
MAHALLEKETLVQEDIQNIIAATKQGSAVKSAEQPVEESEPVIDAADEPEMGDPQPQE